MVTQEKILFVDDEPAVLQGYQRLLRGSFRIDTAVGGKGALISLTCNGPYAVVVSDMRMPEMSGLEFLSQVKRVSPDTVRILLTGQAALESAIGAINDSNIFRFLTKPCAKEKLSVVLAAAVKQYHLQTTEKELVEQTFVGVVQMLVDVLGLVNPAAFSRALRLRKYVRKMAEALGWKDHWQVEVAAMMSQLGCVALDPDLIAAVHRGQALPAEEQARYDRHPEVAQRLLANIPRVETIAWMIGHQNKSVTLDADIANREKAEMRKGAQLLRQALDFDDFVGKGASRVEAGHRLGRKYRELDQDVLLSLIEMEPEVDDLEIMTCPVEQLSTGMIIYEDVYSSQGLLVAAKGQEISLPLRLKLDSFHEKEPFNEGIKVSIPNRLPA